MTRSRYFLLICIVFILGTGAGSFFDVSVWFLLSVSGFAAMLFFSTKNGKYHKEILVLLIFMLGFANIEAKSKVDTFLLARSKIENGQDIVFEGKIRNVGNTKKKDQTFTLSDIKNKKNGASIAGDVLIYAEQYPKYNEGDVVTIEGKLSEPENFKGFDYRMYLATKGVYYIVYYPTIEVESKGGNFTGYIRNKIYELNKKIYPDPQSGIMNALILGVEYDISENILDAFNKTGTRHLLAVSGFNISIIAIMLMQLFLFLGAKRERAFYFASLGIIIYIAIIESSSSSIRAGIMGEISLLAFRIGRLSCAANAIIFAAAAMLVENPYLLRYDVGFQLSFLAVMGLIFIYPKFDLGLEGIKDFFGLKSIFLGTVSAQIATFPILVSNFGNFSALSILSNILILPFAVAIMIGGFAVIGVANLSLYLARVISWPIWLMMQYQVEVIKTISKFNMFSVDMKGVDGFFIITYYFLISLFVWKGHSLINFIRRKFAIKNSNCQFE